MFKSSCSGSKVQIQHTHVCLRTKNGNDMQHTEFKRTQKHMQKQTSATSRVSSSPKKHAALKALIRSVSLPQSGTVMVYVDDSLIPSVLMTVNIIVRIVVEGNGSDRYINGSNVTETFLQRGQISVDRY